ncbi:MAG: hypothetical protein AVDCRST_MAG02-3532, partial [uncultured Rubrobacteraceae bacterium]
GRARTGRGVRPGVAGGSRAVGSEHQRDSGRPEAAAPGAGRQADRAREDRAGACWEAGRARGGAARGCGRVHARVPHNVLANRDLSPEPVPRDMARGPDRLCYIAHSWRDTRRGGREHLEESRSQAPQDHPYPPAERQLAQGADKPM